MTVAEFATKRVVSTTMILIFMIFSGWVAMTGMKQERIPDFDIPIVVINATWTGATAEDVKTQVSKKLEDAALNVDGIKNITTSSSYGSSVVTIEFNYGVNTDIKQVQVQTQIDKIKGDLPNDDNFSDPVVSKMDATGNSNMALMIGITGKNQPLITSFVEETLQPRLKRNRGIGNITIMGNATRQIKVWLDPARLKEYNLSSAEIYSKIKAANSITPAGTITDGSKEFILKVDGEIKELSQIQDIIISNKDNKTVRLADVAKVEYGTEDKKAYVSYNGKDMVAVMIQKSKDGNLVEVANRAKQTLKEAKPLFPSGSDYTVIVDNSEQVSESIKNVASSGIQAIIITIIVLFVFLKNLRASLVVGALIPISAMFTFFLLATQGVTLNMVSLMGLSLAVGSLVDNGVVTLDNIFDHIQINKEPANVAAVRGTNEVILPMMASTATSVCVFLPIILFEGLAKEVFKGIALSMMFALSTSIVVAMLLVPMASSLFLDVEKISGNAEKAVKFNAFRDKYRELVGKVLENRWKTVIGVIIAFVIVVFGIGKTVKTTFFPTIDDNQYSVVASLATGLDLSVSEDIANKMEAVVKADPATKDVNVIAMKQAAIVNVDVKKDTMKAMARVRDKLKNLPNVTLAVVPQKSGGRSVQKDYSFQIEGEDQEELERIANAMMADMKTQSWFKDIKSSTEGGYPQAKLEVDRVKAESYGISVTDITQMLYMTVAGAANPIDVTQSTETLDVVLELEKSQKNSLDKIMNLEIKTNQGTFVRLSDIATMQFEESASSISTENGSRIVTIGANLDSSKGFNDAAAFIQKSFQKTNPAVGYKIGTAGQAKNQAEMGGQIMKDLLLAIALIYTVLAVQLESFILPIMIMTTLPLSMIGVIFGLAITRVQLSMFVMIGILMLFGMAVNNAIVMLDFVAGLRKKGWSIHDALVEACGSRLRPILMTTLTTILGWLPMVFSNKGSSGYYQGMAIAVMFGLSFCTVLTLFFTPVLYSLVEERKEQKQKEREERRRQQKAEERKGYERK
ncbi:efflux RND transporter permease subunit [Leptotrichia sp. oral taxon 847]|uniref:efflux RND transporter permease subunit n=1 Tax=Leptotrichia sp. oral taxon 847 TaxID=1785996 RepID=UPI0007683A26|nr:efflux RND transporter permease subunit [Leptotrichia sp. oral taxon 847]AMD95351.1 acriflavin resistance protein [Leptotrichia sp. oral taxon 847]